MKTALHVFLEPAHWSHNPVQEELDLFPTKVLHPHLYNSVNADIPPAVKLLGADNLWLYFFAATFLRHLSKTQIRQ